MGWGSCGTVTNISDETMPDSAFIFDIDGTLVDLRKIWEQTYTLLYQQKHNLILTPAELKSMFGPPELEGHTAILTRRNIYTPERAQELVTATETTMVSIFNEANLFPSLLPGVFSCLHDFYQARVPLACATGNIPSIGKAILSATKIAPYFSVVACSEPETKARSDIVQRALDGLRNQGNQLDLEKVYVIGDSPSDVTAAQQVGVKSVAVATGHYSVEELAAYHPNIVLKDLRGLSAAVENFK